MRRTNEFDLAARLAPGTPRIAGEAVVAAACVGLAVVTRLTLQLVLPGAGAFILSYPAALLACLLGGWRAGVMALFAMVTIIWYALLPPQFAFAPLGAEAAVDLALNALSGLLVVLIGHALRGAGGGGAKSTGAMESRDLLLRELNHRVKNNFQMVAGLLDMQRRAAPEPATAEALEGVIGRVRSLAQAHAALYVPSGEMETIDFSRYLNALCQNLSDSLLLNTLVHLTCASEPANMRPERAAALGVVINELVTNAVKHAFPDGRSGTISIHFASHGAGWRLTVADDGVGFDPSAQTTGGIGRRLVQAFVRQAGGTLVEGEGPGSVFLIDLPA